MRETRQVKEVIILSDMFVFHGHGEGDNGSQGNGHSELAIAKEITTLVVRNLKSKGVNVLTNLETGYNNYNRNLTKGQPIKYKMGCVIHINSGGGKGSEIILPLKEKYIEIEKGILSDFEKLGSTNRGLKVRYYDTELFDLKQPYSQNGTDYYKEIRDAWNNGISLSIFELAFIDNLSDIKNLMNKKEEYAKVIANRYLQYMGKELITSNNTTQSQQGYTVQVGFFKNKENADKLCKELKIKGYDCFVKEKL